MIIEPPSRQSLLAWMESYWDNLGPIIEDWEKYKDEPQRWNVLRRLYAYLTPRLLAGERWSPYLWDWAPVFTPIERDIWFSIRSIGLPFFPQYPILRFFVDFADPVTRLVIECDGKQWHDEKKDAARDTLIKAEGWRVFRFSGHRCFLPETDPDSAHLELLRIASGYYGRNYREQIEEIENAAY